MAFVYILECADGTLYTGWTTDLARRLAAHTAGRGSRYTRGRRPVRLAYWEEHSTSRQARRREAALRRLRRTEKLTLIASNPSEGRV
jgi:putative endonuclease